MGNEAIAIERIAHHSRKCQNRNHRGVVPLLSFVNGRLDDRQRAESAIRCVAEDLVGRIDIDPVLKHDFLLLLAARRHYCHLFGHFVDPALDELCDRCSVTYNHIRQLAFAERDGFRGSLPPESLRTYEQFAALPRYDRLCLQAHLIRQNATEMRQVYEFLANICAPQKGTLLNIGDGVQFNDSFLRRLAAQMHRDFLRCHVFTVDLSAGIFRLQREASVALRTLKGTFSFLQMDGSAMPFLPEVFDAAVGSFMFDECDDQQALLHELRRVLKLGGRACLSGHHLDALLPADHFVHNFGDAHEVHGRPTTFRDVLHVAANAKLSVLRSLQLAHAWTVELIKE